MYLFDEIADHDAEAITGGEGLGKIVNKLPQIAKELDLSPKELAELAGFKNLGEARSALAQFLNGST